MIVQKTLLKITKEFCLINDLKSDWIWNLIPIGAIYSTMKHNQAFLFLTHKEEISKVSQSVKSSQWITVIIF